MVKPLSVSLALLVVIGLPLGVALAQDYGPKDVARCAAFDMAQVDVQSADPNSAARSRGRALAFSSVAIRMGYSKTGVMAVIEQERDLWHGQLMAAAELDDPDSRERIAAMTAMCNSITQAEPELLRYR